MNLYPSIRAEMGSWTYYIIRMTMRDVANNIKFASEVWNNRTLDDAIQRVLNKSRAKKEIVDYLTNQEDRFFSAIVVAAIGGDPVWFPVDIAGTPEMSIFAGDGSVSRTFGLLRFDGRQKYYVLDGQHRLYAIKEVVDNPNRPKDFEDEHVPVIFVVPGERESEESFLVRHRRLFGNLNRYAKPTGPVTNIIMDEDDVFAILTRRLLIEHPLFKPETKPEYKPRVKTEKGENIRDSDTYFTSLVTLYKINRELLLSKERRSGSNGWPELGKTAELKRFIRFRPSDDTIDELYSELLGVWNALVDIIPTLMNDPTSMRGAAATVNSALFRPIGQKIMAEIARQLLDDGVSQGHSGPGESLMPLGRLNWDMHQVPWRNLLFVQDPVKENWKMRSEDRTKAIKMVADVILFQIGQTDDFGGVRESLRERWRSLVLPLPRSKDNRDDVDTMWGAIVECRK